MALEENKTGLEFETMLRRHLRNGGVPVAACSGFDADTAGAYLENVLGSMARARFESHLAECPACRRHIIELSRLPQLAPQTASPVSIVSAPQEWWLRWKSTFTEQFDHWFDFSWNWRLTGVALAACVVLTTAIIMQPWRRMIQPDAVSTVTGSMAISSASPQTAQPMPLEEFKSDINTDRQQSAQTIVQQNVPAPKLQVTPARNGQNEEELLARGQAGSELKRESSSSVSSLVATDAARPPLAISTGFPQSPAANASDSMAGQRAIRTVADTSAQPNVQKAAVEPGFAPLPDDNPMRRAKKSESKSSGDKDSAVPRQLGLYDRVLSFMPSRKQNSGEKATAIVKDDETVSPLTRKFRDKTFRYERGMWIDQSYKSEIMAWRVKRLTRGSQEFQRLQADEPALKEIFDFGPVIVVWGDKVYRVSGN